MQKTRLQLTVPELNCLTAIFMLTKPMTANEKFILVPMGQLVEEVFVQEDAELGVISNLVEKGLIAPNAEHGYATTSLGAQYILRCKSFTPDFAQIANGDPSAAIAMIFRGFEALETMTRPTAHSPR